MSRASTSSRRAPEPMVASISPARPRILLAEDEINVRKVIAAHLRRSGYEVVEAQDSPSARAIIGNQDIDLVLTDLKMPDSEQDGFEVLRFVVQRTPKHLPRVPVLILTAHGTADKAVEALSQGAYNLISKPCDMKELLTQVRNALQERADALETLDTAPVEAGKFGIIGKTPAMLRLFETIAMIADTPATVLITGESGTGKELVAKALHLHSSRASKPLVKINAAAIPESLVESELFGHEKGAFTGAVATRAGRFEQANTGTLFLDELGELKLDLQVKLLRVLQEQEFERVGGVRTLKVDVRVIAATNRNLQERVRAGLFREDLYYRLNVVPIHLPPLRERTEDLPLLVEHFIGRCNKRLGKNIVGMDRTVLELLGRYPWPGNIRELENVIERMILFSDSAMLSIRDLPPELLEQMKKGTPASSPRSDSVKTEPGKIELGRTEFGKTDLGKTEFGKTEFGKIESGRGELSRSELGKGDPPRVDVLRTEPPRATPEALLTDNDPQLEIASSESGQAEPPSPPSAPLSFKDLVREHTSALERDIILQALEVEGWNVTHTAERLGLSRKGLQLKMKELDIRKKGMTDA